MESIDRYIRRHDWFQRRRDLLRAGYVDAHLRAALAARSIFRVRQGWYSVPDAPEAAVRAVRVGGRLTGVAALESYGLRVPRKDRVDIAVRPSACRLRRPTDRRSRLGKLDGTVTRWIDSRGGSPWRVSIDDALLVVVRTESRDIAVACASAVMRFKKWSWRRMKKVFERAPRRVRGWFDLVSDTDEAHGETFVRLWYHDAGVWCESQPRAPNGRRLDFRVGPHTFVEVDGAQHDPTWTGEGGSVRHKDVLTDIGVVAAGGSVLRFDYAMLYGDWERCLAATKRAVLDDVELTARRAGSPRAPRAVARVSGAHRKAARRRRKRAATVPPTVRPESPAFWSDAARNEATRNEATPGATPSP